MWNSMPIDVTFFLFRTSQTFFFAFVIEPLGGAKEPEYTRFLFFCIYFLRFPPS